MTANRKDVGERSRIVAEYAPHLLRQIEAKEASLTLDQRFDAVLCNPDIITLSALVEPSNRSGNGRTSVYPNFVWLFIGALVGTRGSQRAVADWVRVPRNWFVFVDTICAIHGEDLRDLIPLQPPSRSTIRHHNKRVMAMSSALTTVASALWIKQAQEQGCLDLDAGDSIREPARGNTVHGDGTVIKSPVRERKAGEKAARSASAATFYECGEDESHPVFGVKFIAASTRRSAAKYDRVMLRFERQLGTKEAEQGVHMIQEIQEGCGGAIKAVAWDGALRGVHRQAILRNIGAVPVAPPHDNTKPRRLRRAEDGTDLWTKEGALVARTITVDGKVRYRPLDLVKILKRPNRDGTFRWYGEFATPGGLVITERFDLSAEDMERAFNRPEHLHVMPKGTPEYTEVYSRRPDAESLNNSLDSSLYRGRMIAYHEDTQDFAMFCFALGQNSISRWVHNLRQQVNLPAAA